MVFIPESYKLLPADMRPRGMYIGHSLSGCVTDILRGWMPLENVKEIHSQTSVNTLEEFTSLIKFYEETRWCTALQNDDHFSTFGSRYEPEMVWHIIGHIVSNNKLWQPLLDTEPENETFPVAPGVYVSERGFSEHKFYNNRSTFVHGCSDFWENMIRYKARINSVGKDANE